MFFERKNYMGVVFCDSPDTNNVSGDGKGFVYLVFGICATVLFSFVFCYFFIKSLPEGVAGELSFETKIEEATGAERVFDMENKFVEWKNMGFGGAGAGGMGSTQKKVDSQEQFLRFIPEEDRKREKVSFTIEQGKLGNKGNILSLVKTYGYMSGNGMFIEYKKEYYCKSSDAFVFLVKNYISYYDNNKFYCEKL